MGNQMKIKKNNIFQTAVTTTPEGRVLQKDEILAEAERVLAIRSAKLVGKTVTGTVYTTGKDQKIRHWLKWNNRKCDAVFVPKELIEGLGDRFELGMNLRTTVTCLGPDLSKLAFKSAWCMHPQCEAIDVVEARQVYRPRRWVPKTENKRFFKRNDSKESFGWRRQEQGPGLCL